MLPETLVALACLIANKGPVETSSVEAQLSKSEMTKVQSIISAGSCLPENMEKLIQETHDKIKDGELRGMSEVPRPTGGCD